MSSLLSGFGSVQFAFSLTGDFLVYLNFLSGDEMDIHEFQVGENSAYGALYPILHGCPGLLLVDDISLKGDDDDDNVWLYSNSEGDGRGGCRGREGGKAKPSCH